MLTDHGNKVTVRCSGLLERIKKNREQHATEYQEAMRGYRAKLGEAALALADACKGEGRPNRGHVIEMPEPEDHTAEYDRVIAMLEMSTAEQCEISERRFREYVLDDWEWSERAKRISSSYDSR